ncbi:accessory Sec system protein Asp1 [Lactobacillus crispatus]|uniref:Accessory Sec system protein Asp1 n=1 Tax=Lactobacillus crispatus TaxID=47770 RepID=A0A7H9E6L1_9LACO|nr:accessory Sec system protein Asp1 [Lactobacillus crispatus]QLL73244.1 accessory Sec system protein Asp1 [Lactobacillus crispatus]
MEYIIPAWHGQLTDWSYNIPQIEIYDGINRMRVLQDSGREVELVLTDYQPQMTTKLNKAAIYPDKIFSVYDKLQGIQGGYNQILSFRDFNWPDDVIFDFSPFRVLVISENRLFAKVNFDTQGKILSVEYFDNQGQKTKNLIIDSRGFISSAQMGDKTVYYDEEGHWRFIHDVQSDHVVINPQFNEFGRLEYSHIIDLIQEAFANEFLCHVQSSDNLIVTIENRSTISYEKYSKYHPIYSLSHWHKYDKVLDQIHSGQLIVPSKHMADTVEGKVDKDMPITIVPSLPVQVRLGHSQRIKRQIIAVFAEKMEYEDLKKIVEVIYQRLIKDPEGEGVHFLTYTTGQDALVTRVIAELKEKYKGKFLTEEESKLQGENDIEEEELPVLYIKQDRLTSTASLLEIFDKIRILINWGKSDDFVQTTAISNGIPQLQNFVSATLINHQNGEICKNAEEIAKGLAKYLDNMNNWNQALVYDVRLLNKYSEDNLVKIWDKVLE